MSKNPAPQPMEVQLAPFNMASNKTCFSASPLSDGGFVTVWETLEPPAATVSEIRIAVFNADGTVRTTERPISPPRARDQISPDITVLSTGDFCVAWIDRHPRGLADRVNVRVVKNTLHNCLTDEILVIDHSETDDLETVAVQALPGGHAVVKRSTPSASVLVVVDSRQRIVEGDHPVQHAGSTRQSTVITPYGQRPFVSEDLDRRIVVAGHYGLAGQNKDPRLELYGGESVPFTRLVETQQLSGTPMASTSPPQLALLPGGRFVMVLSGATRIVWRFLTPANDQRNFMETTPSPSEIKTADIPGKETYGAVTDGVVAALSDGGFVIVFTAIRSSGGQSDVFGLRFDTRQQAAGSIFPINTSDTGDCFRPAVLPRKDAGFTVLWQGPETGGGNGNAIFSRTYRKQPREAQDDGDGSLITPMDQSLTIAEAGLLSGGDEPSRDAVFNQVLYHGISGSASLEDRAVTRIPDSDFAGTARPAFTPANLQQNRVERHTFITVNQQKQETSLLAGDRIIVVADDPDRMHASGNILSHCSGAAGAPFSVIAVNNRFFHLGATADTLFGSIEVAANGAYTYRLDSGNTSVKTLSEGDTLDDCAVLTVKDGQGHVRHVSIVIEVRGASGFDTKSIAQSAVFDGAADYLTFTPMAGVGATKAVLSCWFQLTGNASASVPLLDTGNGNASAQFVDRLRLDQGNLDFLIFRHPDVIGRVTTNRILRDIGWYHVVLSVDTSLPQERENDRIQIFINGERETDLSVNLPPPQNFSTFLGAAGIPHEIGKFAPLSPSFGLLDGYVAQPCFLHGQSIQNGDVNLFDFGTFAEAGKRGKIWSPVPDAAVAGCASAAGGNSFCLAGLIGDGIDASANGSDFTAVSMSHANNGSANTPSNVHPTINRLDCSSEFSIFNGGLEWTAGDGVGGFARTTMPLSSGKWYFEIHTDAAPASQFTVGITEVNTPVSADLSDTGAGLQISNSENRVRYWTSGIFGAELEAAVDGQAHTYMVALDFSSGKGWFGRNGRWYGTFSNSPGGTPPARVFTGNPETGVNPTFTFDKTKSHAPSIGRESGPASARDPRLVFEEEKFSHVRPSGFAVINSASLPTPPSQGADIYQPCAYDADDAAGAPCADTDFQADFDWIQGRTGPGFVNTDGSTESVVRTTDEGDFSAVSYRGNSVAGTSVGHGLPGAPEMLIVRSRNTVSGWRVWHKALPGVEHPDLETAAATATASSLWNSVKPDASKFTLGNASETNNIGDDFVACLFRSVPGLSLIGSYIGNGSVDGPFIHCGFAPGRIVIKPAAAGDTDWSIHDTERGAFTMARCFAGKDSPPLEKTAGPREMDILSTGFKLRGGPAGKINRNGQTYIFLAVAYVAGGGALPPVPGR